MYLIHNLFSLFVYSNIYKYPSLFAISINILWSKQIYLCLLNLYRKKGLCAIEENCFGAPNNLFKNFTIKFYKNNGKKRVLFIYPKGMKKEEKIKSRKKYCT